MDDVLAEGAQPRCPECAVVMRTHPDAWRCPACGHSVAIDTTIVQPVFTGPAIRGW